jgi:hypothetical protein
VTGEAPDRERHLTSSEGWCGQCLWGTAGDGRRSTYPFSSPDDALTSADAGAANGLQRPTDGDAIPNAMAIDSRLMLAAAAERFEELLATGWPADQQEAVDG